MQPVLLHKKDSKKSLELYQPILSQEPEHNHPKEDVLSLANFLTLLREEEDYFPGEQENIKLMITRIRKIYYDKWGWDTVLIRKAASIEGRYDVKIIECPPEMDTTKRTLKHIKRYSNNDYVPQCRKVTYKENDRVYGNSRVGQVPEIYDVDHADVQLPDGYYSDMGHVLAGLDALNYPQIVSPLPDSLLFLHRIFPYAKSNADVTTWLGDIATSSADFLVAYLKNGKKPLNKETEQQYININASASDMLGNIDSYVIHILHKNNQFKGKRLSEILEEYYGDHARGNKLRSQRFKIFTEYVGLEWNGQTFTNETQWIKSYKGQLRSTISFMIYSSTSETTKKVWLPFLTWIKVYDKEIKIELVLKLFLKELKKLM